MTTRQSKVMNLKDVVAASIVWILLLPGAAFAQEEVVYYHTDAIGSVRAMTDATGATIARFDFLPFGELWSSNPPAPLESRQFGGKERERIADFDLDYFGARYHFGLIGRFTSVDPVSNFKAALTDPQRWNRYSYVFNRPFTMIDPDGREAGYVYLQNGRMLSPYDRDFPRSQNPVSDTLKLAAAFGGGLFGGPIASRVAAEAQVAIGRLLLWAGTAAGAERTAELLRRAAADRGETLRIVTNQTQFPAAGRTLFSAVGENAQAAANAMRSGEGVRTFVADIPKALLNQLEKAGYLRIRTMETMDGLLTKEYVFGPKAYDYIVKFLKETPQ